MAGNELEPGSNSELMRTGFFADPVTQKVVLEVRPSAEDSATPDRIAAWAFGGGLGGAARIAGFRESEVTHVRIWRGDQTIELSVQDLRDAWTSRHRDPYGTKADPQAEIAPVSKELDWTEGGSASDRTWDGSPDERGRRRSSGGGGWSGGWD